MFRRYRFEIILSTTIVAVFTAIAVPNLHTAMQRSSEKRTMAAMRDIATVWEARAETLHRYAVEDVRDLPRLDGWKQPMELTASGDSYRIRSYGSDRRRDVKLIATSRATSFSPTGSSSPIRRAYEACSEERSAPPRPRRAVAGRDHHRRSHR